jgi:acetyltransferase-like isoleucine patch superfamily enzyme
VQRDPRPYGLKRAYLKFQHFYVDHFLRPQLSTLGPGHTFFKPWHIELFGGPIEIGAYVNVVATPDRKVRLSVWSPHQGQGRITIGSYAMVCPGVRIGSAIDITIGDNCMLASNVYIADSDWHGLYDRVSVGRSEPVRLEENVWVGDSAIICKGVTIGANSVVGAGAVVVDAVPGNVVVAGNPARVVKHLDPGETFTKRSRWFARPERLARDIDDLDRLMLGRNTYLGWLRQLIFPRKQA